jgi:hypothetical protein
MRPSSDMKARRGEVITTMGLWLAFVLMCAALLFQLVPAAWWWTVSVVDVRHWTWRSYAVIFAVAIAVLIVAKGRQDN